MAQSFRFEGGYLYAGTIAGIPLRLHFTLPLICFLIGGFHIRPLLWVLVIGIVLWHELGHAAIEHCAKELVRVLLGQVAGAVGAAADILDVVCKIHDCGFRS
jgi:hypothetical protein